MNSVDHLQVRIYNSLCSNGYSSGYSSKVAMSKADVLLHYPRHMSEAGARIRVEAVFSKEYEYHVLTALDRIGFTPWGLLLRGLGTILLRQHEERQER